MLYKQYKGSENVKTLFILGDAPYVRWTCSDVSGIEKLR